MINNELLRRIATIFDLSTDKLVEIFALNGCTLSASDIAKIFKPADDGDYKALLDVEFSSFLNGLIIYKRGAKEGPAPVPEASLSNNAIFNKIKIALALQADEVLSVLALADLNLGKYELSAFFRNVNHKHYRECSDDVLSAFLKGLKLKFQS